MTDDVERHYEGLLAANYTWMFGVPFDTKVSEQREWLESVLAGHGAFRGPAIDLGAGPGFQSIALADMGFSPVFAVDTSRRLLEELEAHRGHRTIATACANLSEIKHLYGATRARIVVCMGDTLPHLPSAQSVMQLFEDAFELLAPGGLLVLTFRDLSAPLEGLDRFIPVRSDPDRIMTCFLEFETDYVTVNDLVYTRHEDGWHFEKSSYRKLRLSPDDLTKNLEKAGFELVVNQPMGHLQGLVAKRP